MGLHPPLRRGQLRPDQDHGADAGGPRLPRPPNQLPLVRRAGHEIVGGRVVVAWLPPAELDPLADAIDRYATAPNKETVANYLRNVTRSAVQPSGHLGGLP